MIADEIKIIQDFRPEGYVFEKHVEDGFNVGGSFSVSFGPKLDDFLTHVKSHFMSLTIRQADVERIVGLAAHGLGDCSQCSGQARRSMFYGIRRELESEGWAANHPEREKTLEPYFT